MTRLALICFLIHCHTQLALTQQADINKLDSFVENTITLSEQSLYDASFDDALHFVEPTHYEKFSTYESKHEISLIVQHIRVQSFRARIHQLIFNNDEQLGKLLGLLPRAEGIEDEYVKAKFYTLLSNLYSRKDIDSCVIYENKAHDLFTKLGDLTSLAVLQATRISRDLSICIRENNKEGALALIPRFREEVEFSSKHSKYALSYNTRHLANIYRIYDVDQTEALSLYKQSLALREEIGFKPFIPASYFSLGEVYVNLGMYESAIDAYNKSIETAENIQFVRYTILPHVKLGDLYTATGKNDKAKDAYAKALNTASKNSYSEQGINDIIDKIIAIEK